MESVQFRGDGSGSSVTADVWCEESGVAHDRNVGHRCSNPVPVFPATERTAAVDECIALLRKMEASAIETLDIMKQQGRIDSPAWYRVDGTRLAVMELKQQLTHLKQPWADSYLRAMLGGQSDA